MEVRAIRHDEEKFDIVGMLAFEIPPPPCPTNALSNEHFRSDRCFWDLIKWVPNDVSNEHSDHIF